MPTYRIPVTTTGAGGSAAGSGTSDIPAKGWITSIRVNYHASAPATTDLTLEETGDQGRTLLTLSNTSTDATKYLAVQQHDSTGTAIVGTYQAVYVSGEYLKVTLAQCDALTDAVVVTVQTME